MVQHDSASMLKGKCERDEGERPEHGGKERVNLTGFYNSGWKGVQDRRRSVYTTFK